MGNSSESDLKCDCSRVFSREKASIPIYCSPLLRALQTAHHVLDPEFGWTQITLLRDAREWLHNEVPIPGIHTPMERDCMSTNGNVGKRIAERALQNDPHLGSNFVDRVAYGDCGEKWWNEKCETREEMRSRISRL